MFDYYWLRVRRKSTWTNTSWILLFALLFELLSSVESVKHAMIMTDVCHFASWKGISWIGGCTVTKKVTLKPRIPTLTTRNNDIMNSVARTSDECDMRRDVLLNEDIASDSSYLQCKPAGRGVVGFWQWFPCPPGQKFYFTEQKCDVPFHQKPSTTTTTTTTTTSSPLTPFTAYSSPHSVTVIVQAYLNDSCAHGQQCAGGTICNVGSNTCVCPMGFFNTPGTRYCQPPVSYNPTVPNSVDFSYNSNRQVSPGSSCKESDVVCIGGSYCNPDNKVCSCPDGSTDELGKCVSFRIDSAGVGQRCNQFTKCDGWSRCIMNVCQCEAPMVQVGFQCLPEEHNLKKEARPGQPCDKGQTCTGGSICSTVTLRCACPVGTKDNGDKCFDFFGMESKLSGVNDHCDVNTDCVIGAFCSASTKPPSCQCLSTHVDLNRVCYRIIYPGQRGCEFDDQCSAAYEGATCVSNLCVCPTGMNAQGQTCRPGGGHLVSPPGGSCAALQQCSGGSMCRNGWCICPDNSMVVSNGMCTNVPVKGVTTYNNFEEKYEKSSSTPFLQNILSVSDFPTTAAPTASWTTTADTTKYFSTLPSSTSTSATSSPSSTTITTRPTTVFWTTSTTVASTIKSRQTFNHFEPEFSGQFPIPSVTVGASLTVGTTTDFPEPIIEETTSQHSFTQKAFAYPGEFCGELTSCTGGSKCLYGQCLCDEKYELFNRHCIPREEVIPLESCLDGEICTGGSVCDGNVCQCPFGTEHHEATCSSIMTSPTTRATTTPSTTPQPVTTTPAATRRPSGVMWAPPMSSCANGERCSGDSMCNRLTLTCECPGDMQPLHGHCVLFVGGGDKVYGKSGEEITDHDYALNNLDNTASGFVPMPVIHQNVDEVLPKSGQGPYPYTAPPGVMFSGYPAQTNVQFPRDNSNLTRPPLSAPSRPNGPCLKDQDCSGGSTCLQNRCVCPPGTMPNSYGTCTIIDVEHFGSQGAPLGSECNSSTICFGASQCINGRCRCPSGLIQDGPVCINLQEKALKHNKLHETMVTFHGAPNEGTRQAIQVPLNSLSIGENYVNKNLTGLIFDGPYFFDALGRFIERPLFERDQYSRKYGKNVSIGDVCTEKDICQGRSTCVFGVCICSMGTKSVNGVCTTVVEKEHVLPKPGQSCVGSESCSGNAICINGSCQCWIGYAIEDDTCIEPAIYPDLPSAPGDPCRHYDDCFGGSYCRLGYCVCPMGTESVNMQCTPMETNGKYAMPGRSCAHGEECTGGSFCLDAMCRCPVGMHPSVDGVCRKLDVGSSFSTLSPNTPQMQNSNQFQNSFNSSSPSFNTGNGAPYQVLNPSGLPPSSAENIPHPVNLVYQNPAVNGNFQQQGTPSPSPAVVTLGPIPGTPCKMGQFCENGAVCSMGFCRCPAGLKQMGDSCLPETLIVPPGHMCTNGQSCSGGSECIHGVCLCKSGQKIVGTHCFDDRYNAAGDTKAKNSARPGEICMNGQRCTGRSFCARDGYCRCPSSTKNDKGVCRKFPGHQRPASTPGRLPASFAPHCPLPENVTACQLPNCYCSKTGRTIPGDLSPELTPQFVVLTFDDPVNSKVIEIYQRMFDNKFFNKNGCPVKATFFVSHEWTNYDEVELLYSQGHEIASNSITHVSLGVKPLSRWEADMDGQRTILSNLAGIPREEITGMRAPQLSLAGDVTFQMMENIGFLYDNSMTTNPGIEQTPFWPQTLDYKIPWECQNMKCPHGPHPGLWEIPINQFFGFFANDISHYKRASVVSAAMAINETYESALNLLKRNFKRAHNSNKAPYVLTLTADFFSIVDEVNMEKVLEQFLQETLQQSDVWIITMRQLIEWMRQPTPLHQLSRFQPFQCKIVPVIHSSGNSDKNVGANETISVAHPCQMPNKCYYKVHALSGGEHLFTSCRQCPPEFPWLNNPDGA